MSRCVYTFLCGPPTDAQCHHQKQKQAIGQRHLVICCAPTHQRRIPHCMSLTAISEFAVHARQRPGADGRAWVSLPRCSLQRCYMQTLICETFCLSPTHSETLRCSQLCTHPCCMPSVAQQQCSGEGLQVLGLGQLGDQALGIHIDPLLFGTGAQVEV